MLNIKLSFKRFIYIGLIAGLAAACQPEPQDRYEKALAYYDNAEFRAAMLELRNLVRQQPDYADARMLLGLVSYQLADFAAAKTEFERAISGGIDTPAAWEWLGRSLVAQGAVEEAFERVLPMIPEESATTSQHALFGDIYTALGNLDEGSASYERALSIDANNVRAIVGKAVVAARRGDSDTAEEILTGATEKHPESALAWRAHGNFLRMQNEPQRAATSYRQSMSVEHPSTPVAEQFSTRVNLITVLVDSSDYESASELFDVVVSDYPRHPLMHYLKGRIAFGTGNYDVAQIELQEYLSQVPQDLRGQAMLGAVNFSMNNYRQAEMYLVQAVRSNVGGEAMRRMLAETQLRLDKPEEAMSQLLSARQHGQDDAALSAMMGRAEIGLGDTEAAIAYFEESVASDPDNPTIRLSLAASYLQAGRTTDAIKLLEAMREGSGGEFRRETLLIGAYLRNGQTTDAVNSGDAILQDNPDEAMAYSLVGVLHKSIGNQARATELFQQALVLDPANQSALFNLGTIAIDRDELDSARSRFNELLRYHPSYLPGLVSMTAVLQQMGATSDIHPYLQSAIEHSPEAVAPRALLARVYMADDDLKSALEVIDAARTVAGNEPALAHLEGLVHLRRDDLARAIRSLRSAAAADPDNPVYLLDLGRARLAAGDIDEAVTLAREYRTNWPADRRGLSFFVEASIRNGDFEAARSVVDDFLESIPEDAQAWLLAGDIELAAGRLQTALERYERSAQLDWTRAAAVQIARVRQETAPERAAESLQRWLLENPDDSGARLMYAQILESTGAIDQATAQYEQLHAIGQLSPVGMNNLAWQYHTSGAPGALELAEQAHQREPQNGNITDTLGWIVVAQGDLDRGVELLRLASEQMPESPDVLYHLAYALAQRGDKAEARNIVQNILSSNESFQSRADAERLAGDL